MSHALRSLSGLLRSRTVFALVFIGALTVGAATVFAVHNTGIFELDGNTADGAGGLPEDFDSVYLGTSVAPLQTFLPDSGQPDATYFGEHNTDDEPAKDWKCKIEQVPQNKTNVMNAYAAAYAINGEVYVFFGADRETVEGDANFGFWFFQNPIGCVAPQNGSGSFTGHKTHGDLFILSEFTNGGTIPTFKIYKWTDPNGIPEDGDECLGNGINCLAANKGQDHPFAIAIDCQSADPHAVNPNACAATNTAPFSAAWRANIPTRAFVEGGINVTNIFPATGCMGGFMAEGRASQEFTADLKDFVLANFNTCGSITVKKVTDPAGNSTQFNFSLAGGPDALNQGFQLADGNSHSVNSVKPGVYTLTETVPGGWSLTDVTCVGGPFGAGATYVNGANIVVDPGDQITCTFTNALQRGTIVVKKVTDPSSDTTTSFGFTAGGGLTPASFSLKNGQTQTFSNLAPGSGYSVAETPMPGWALIGATCDNGNPVSNVQVTAGQTVTCTFKNLQVIALPKATLIVKKVVTNNSGGAATPGDFTLSVTGNNPSPASFAGSLAGTTVTLDPGAYGVTETGGPAGYVTTFSSQCSGTIGAGETRTCTVTNNDALAAGPGFCAKATVKAAMSPSSGVFLNNAGVDILVRVDLGESIQAALDVATDLNGDGYILVGVIANSGGALGGHTTQRIVIGKNYPKPFGLVACSVTLHDPSRADGQPTARIAAGANSPRNIFVMDLHAADSEVAGWKVEGDGRALRNVFTSNNATGIWVMGNNNTIQGGVHQANTGVGIKVEGTGNVVDTVAVMASGSHGFQVVGDNNQLLRIDAGDRARGNDGDGVNVSGDGNLVSEADAFANGGSGISVTGNQNQLMKNDAGDLAKGNGADGIRVAGWGNILQANRAQANMGDGFGISGGAAASPNRLKGNQSNTGSSGSSKENKGAEYRLLGHVRNDGGPNKADNIAVPKTSSPAKCANFPSTNATVNFSSANLCE